MKILVLTTYRTGSTHLCAQLAQQHKLENFDECFHESLHPMTRAKLINELQCTDNWVVKLMPWHDQCADKDGVSPNPLLTLLKHADRVICLLRKDLNAQVKSYWITKMCGQLKTNHQMQLPGWHDEFTTPIDFNSIDTVNYTYTHKGDEITVSRSWCEIISLSLPRYRKFLFGEIKWIHNALKDVPGVETMYTEDLQTGEKYNRPFVMPNSFPKLCTGYTLDQLAVTE